MSLKTKPETVFQGGAPLKCVICTQTAFHRRKTHLATAMSQELNPEWKDLTGYCLICDACGHIHWFVERAAPSH